jgi:mono/diheme cytochrome c family protein
MAVAAALALAACGFGEEGIAVSEDDPNYNGAVLFATHCSGCHTMKAAGSQGTGNRSIRTQGPNLDQRTESYEDALFAIQNGGFSGAIMPQNIVVGEEAEAVARFVAKYSGSDAEESPRPEQAGEPAPLRDKEVEPAGEQTGQPTGGSPEQAGSTGQPSP